MVATEGEIVSMEVDNRCPHAGRRVGGLSPLQTVDHLACDA
jgi:hypothetical protein